MELTNLISDLFGGSSSNNDKPPQQTTVFSLLVGSSVIKQTVDIKENGIVTPKTNQLQTSKIDFKLYQLTFPVLLQNKITAQFTISYRSMDEFKQVGSELIIKTHRYETKLGGNTTVQMPGSQITFAIPVADDFVKTYKKKLLSLRFPDIIMNDLDGNTVNSNKKQKIADKPTKTPDSDGFVNVNINLSPMVKGQPITETSPPSLSFKHLFKSPSSTTVTPVKTPVTTPTGKIDSFSHILALETKTPNSDSKANATSLNKKQEQHIDITPPAKPLSSKPIPPKPFNTFKSIEKDRKIPEMFSLDGLLKSKKDRVENEPQEEYKKVSKSTYFSSMTNSSYERETNAKGKLLSLYNDDVMIQYPKKNTDENGKVIPQVTIIRSDLKKLDPGEFLNDSIIEFYQKYIIDNFITEQNRDKFFFFNSFFYKKFTIKSNYEETYKDIRKWTLGTDIFQKDFIIIPINKELHWSLVIICFPGEEKTSSDYSRRPCMIYLDSLYKRPKEVDEILRTYLELEWKNKKSDLPPRSFSNTDTFPMLIADVPQQNNFSDCGVFLLHYVELFSKLPETSFKDPLQKPDWFTQEEIAIKRSQIRGLIFKLRKESNPNAMTEEEENSCRIRYREGKSTIDDKNNDEEDDSISTTTALDDIKVGDGLSSTNATSDSMPADIKNDENNDKDGLTSMDTTPPNNVDNNISCDKNINTDVIADDKRDLPQIDNGNENSDIDNSQSNLVPMDTNNVNNENTVNINIDQIKDVPNTETNIDNNNSESNITTVESDIKNDNLNSMITDVPVSILNPSIKEITDSGLISMDN